jgi:hypothetical protein
MKISEIDPRDIFFSNEEKRENRKSVSANAARSRPDQVYRT